MKGKQIDVCFPFFVDVRSLLLAEGRGSRTAGFLSVAR